MKARLSVPILLLVLLAGLCSACSKAPAEREPVTAAPVTQEVPAETTAAVPAKTTEADAETAPATQTPPESETAETTPFEPAAVVIPAPEMGDKVRLSERPAEEIIDYLYDFGYDFMSDAGSKPDPKKDKETVEKTLALVREAEESPYSFMGHANYYLINNSYETLRKAVCAYYEWPVIRLLLENRTDGGTVVSEFQLWSLPDAFFGRDTKTTETGVRMVFISPSAQKPDFRRKMTIYLESAEVITQKEQEEDPSTVLKDSAGYGSYSGASAVIYDHGDNAYTIYLRPEDGPAAVKIEASLTLEEMAALLSSCRLFDASVQRQNSETMKEPTMITEAEKNTTVSENDSTYDMNLVREREASHALRDLARTIEISPFIFTGTCTVEADKDRIYTVTVNKVFRGEVADEVFMRSRDYFLEESKEYLFFTEIHGNVIIDRVYHVVKDVVDIKDGNLYSVAIQDLKDWTYDRLISELPELVEKNPSILSPEIVLDYIHSTDYDEIAEQSEYVADLRLIEISRVLSDRMWCNFEIVHMIKGELDQTVFMVVPLNSVIEGETYRICFNGIDGSTNVCGISAPNSIWPSEP